MAWDEATYIINEVKKNQGNIVVGEGPAFGSDGGSGLPPQDVYAMTATNVYDGKIEVTVSLSGTDVVLSGSHPELVSGSATTNNLVTVTRLGGLKIIRKQGGAPRNYNDGVLCFDRKWESWEVPTQVKFTDTGLTNEVTYYYAAYPYSDHNVINYKRAKVVSAKPTAKPTHKIFGFQQNFADKNPATTITYPGTFANASFTPLTYHTSSSPYYVDVGDWEPFFSETLYNHPFVINKTTGEAVVQLDSKNYLKDVNGNTITQQTYDEENHGWFAWMNTVYTHEEYSSDGNSREVQFTTGPVDGFHPVGFSDGPKAVYQPRGIWIPIYPMMYVASDEMYVVNPFRGGVAYATNKTYKKVVEAVKKYSDHPLSGAGVRAFAIGPFLNTFRDLLYMISKTTRFQSVFGTSSTENITNSAAFSYNTNNVYGRFYTFQDAYEAANLFRRRVFCSYALANNAYSIADNSCFRKDGTFYYSFAGSNNEYGGDRSVAGLMLGDRYLTVTPTKLQYVDSYFGSIPVISDSDSSTALNMGIATRCQNTWISGVTGYYYCMRNGYENIGSTSFNISTSANPAYAMMLPLLTPPPGYSPNPLA